MAYKVDLAGKKFGRLKAIEPTDERIEGRVVWRCKCDCGKEAMVDTHSLKMGNTKSCGCLVDPRRPQEDDRMKLMQPVLDLKEWTKRVFAKDLFTCQRCSSKDEQTLVAHHVGTFGNNPKLRTRVGNGTTLCLACQQDFYHCYGNSDNTERQFERWLRMGRDAVRI